jgi:hypothetical protein
VVGYTRALGCTLTVLVPWRTQAVLWGFVADALGARSPRTSVTGSAKELGAPPSPARSAGGRKYSLASIASQAQRNALLRLQKSATCSLEGPGLTGGVIGAFPVHTRGCGLSFLHVGARVESSRASPPHRPREEGHNSADTSRTNLAYALGLLSRWRLSTLCSLPTAPRG